MNSIICNGIPNNGMLFLIDVPSGGGCSEKVSVARYSIKCFVNQCNKLFRSYGLC